MTDREEQLMEVMRQAIREDLESEDIEDVEGATEKAMQPIRTFFEQEEDAPEQYPDIPLEEVHEGVREAIQDYKESGSERPLLYWLLKTGTPPYKMSKEESGYTAEAQDPRYSCATCEFLYTETTTGKHVCSQIRGYVEPEGWCNRWTLADAYEHVDLQELESDE